MEWSIRNLLQPVIARMLIYGVNPIDLEYVIGQVEKVPLINKGALTKAWLKEWQVKIDHFLSLADRADEKGNRLSAKQFLWYVTQCYYAMYLINCEKVEEKKVIYENYAAAYNRYIHYDNSCVEEVEVTLEDGNKVPGYLHLPKEPASTPYPGIILFGGIGSAKEELHTQAMPLIERGIAVLACDMPGMGAALFERNIKCNGKQVEMTARAAIKFLEKHQDINEKALGTCGLCMGGGYAYHAATLDEKIKCCVNLFPLFVTQIDQNHIPKWMKAGEWATYQYGESQVENFIESMKVLEEGKLKAAYLFIHGAHDNWMTLETAEKLYSSAQGYKEKIIINETPVYSIQQSITHTMPVGEQMHWIKYVIADWMKEQLTK